MITGLRFGGIPIPSSSDLFEERGIELFGQFGAQLTSTSVTVATVKKAVLQRIGEPLSEQLTCLFLFFLYYVTIGAEFGNRTYPTMLGAFEDLERMREFDWGSTAYATVLGYMRSNCRARGRPTLDGLYRLLEVWFYEYFTGQALVLSNAECVLPTVFWWSADRRAKGQTSQGWLALQTNQGWLALQSWLDIIPIEELSFQPWASSRDGLSRAVNR